MADWERPERMVVGTFSQPKKSQTGLVSGPVFLFTYSVKNVEIMLGIELANLVKVFTLTR